MRTSRRGLQAAAAALALSFPSAPATQAGIQVIANTCAAGKIECVKAKATKVASCYASLLKKPIPDPPAGEKLSLCLEKALSKFLACMAKQVDKQKPGKPETTCAFPNDATVVGNLTFAFVGNTLVTAVHPGQPTTPNTCAASKLKCATAKAKALLCCHVKSLKKGAVVDGTCLQKARDKFDGGANPSKGCFAKLEAKQKQSKPATVCPTQGDTATVEADVDDFVADMLSQLLTGAVPP